MNRYFHWKQTHSARFLTVLDNAMEMRVIGAKQGQVVVDDSTQKMSDPEIAENIKQALLHGFREISEGEFSKEQSRLTEELQRLTTEPNVPGAEIAAWQEVKSEFKQYLSNDPEEYLTSILRSFCVYSEPARLNGDLKIKFDSKGLTAQTPGRNLIFKKGPIIDGNFDAGEFTTELPQLIIVTGDLHAKNLILTGWVEVVVTGDVRVDGLLFGYDGEAGGRLKVHGNLSANELLGGMTYNIAIAGRTEADVYWTDDDEATLPRAREVQSTLSSEQALQLEKHTPLVKEAYVVDSNWATGKEVQTLVFAPLQVVDLIRKGKPVLRKSTG